MSVEKNPEDSYSYLETYNKTPPSICDLKEQVDAGFIKRGILRYLISNNPERSVRIHRAIGTPVACKLIMGTVGRAFPQGSGGNYRLDNRKNRLERVTHYALYGGVYNEAVHSTIGLLQVGNMALNATADVKSLSFHAGFVAFEAGLVAVQRYNRARSIVAANKALQIGEKFGTGYINWAGIDSKAVNNYYSQSTHIENTIANGVLYNIREKS